MVLPFSRPRNENGDAAGEPPEVLAVPVPTVLLIGNPNVGKSLLFKNLTNRYVNVSNFPGTTVEITRARADLAGRPSEVIDSPGVNDLAPKSDDARVTRQLLDRHPGATVIQVADAKNLRRALLLTLQLAELGHPMVLVLNMLDELATRGGRIDREKLAAILGVPVVGTIAARNEGTRELAAAVADARPPALVLEIVADGEIADPYERNRRRLAQVNGILAETYTTVQPQRASFAVRLGFWAMHPVKGAFVLLALLGFVFWFVGLFGAGTLVDALETGLFRQRLSPLAIRATDALLPFPHTHAREVVELDVSLPVTPVHEIQLLHAAREIGVAPEHCVYAGDAERDIQAGRAAGMTRTKTFEKPEA